MKSIEIDRSKRLNERIANSRVLRQRSPSSWPPPPRHKRLESDADAAGADATANFAATDGASRVSLPHELLMCRRAFLLST
jgi:hypothetical protein